VALGQPRYGFVDRARLAYRRQRNRRLERATGRDLGGTLPEFTLRAPLGEACRGDGGDRRDRREREREPPAHSDPVGHGHHASSPVSARHPQKVKES
jgi:hypothetical protein